MLQRVHTLQGKGNCTTSVAMMQVMDFLEENMAATPEALGDMHKETPEERAERHERVLASSLAAMRSLLDCLLPKEASAPKGMPICLVAGILETAFRRQTLLESHVFF